MTRPVIFLAISLCVWGAAVGAQVSPTAPGPVDLDSLRQVRWGTVTIGSSTVRVRCDSCDGPAASGVDLLVAVGGVRDRHIRGGVTMNFWRSQRAETMSGMVSVYYYPALKGRLFLEGGFGGSWLCLRAAGSTCSSTSGIAFTAGLGYGLRPRHDVLLKPRIAFTHASYGDPVSDSPVANTVHGWRQSTVSFGIGLQWER